MTAFERRPSVRAATSVLGRHPKPVTITGVTLHIIDLLLSLEADITTAWCRFLARVVL
ncbi:MAG: hypothetical protein ACKVP3_14895 [Hyphomicrobiaceae bacterium]